VATINAALVMVFDAALAPLLRLPAAAGLLVISIVTAIVLVLIMRRMSDQQRLRATRNRMQAALFEIRLQADDPVAVLRSFGDVLVQNAIYLRLTVVPLLWIILPLSLMLAQLQAFYGYTGVTRGVPTLITLESAANTPVTLEAPREIRVETDPVPLIGSTNTVWRIVPEAEGAFALTLRSGESRVVKTIVVGDRPARRSPLRAQAGFERLLLNPSEPLIPAGTVVASVGVDYHDARINVFGWNAHWLIVYGLFSLVSALLVSRWLGVTI
jgi:hypothetical protein